MGGPARWARCPLRWLLVLCLLVQGSLARPRAWTDRWVRHRLQAVPVARRIRIPALLRPATRARKIATLIVLHDLGVAARFVDQLALMHGTRPKATPAPGHPRAGDGRLLPSDPPDEKPCGASRTAGATTSVAGFGNDSGSARFGLPYARRVGE